MLQMVLVVKESQPSSAVSHNVIVILTVRFLTLEIPPPLLMVRRSIPEKLCHRLLLEREVRRHAIRDREIETDWAKSRVAQGILGNIVPEKLDSIEKLAVIINLPLDQPPARRHPSNAVSVELRHPWAGPCPPNARSKKRPIPL